MIEGQESQAGARMRSTSIRRTTVAVVLVLLALVLAFGSWGGEDHGRVARQKKLLKAVIAQTTSIRNAWRLPQKSSVLCRRQL